MTKDFYKYMTEKEDDTNIDSEEVGSGKAKNFSKVSAKKSKKYKIPVSSKDGKFGKFVKTVLLNMINTSKGQEKGSLLLKGDPGTGKCLEENYLLDIKFSEDMEQQYLEFKKGRK